MTPEQQAEAERSTLLFHTALVAMGNQSIKDTLSLWEDVPAVPGVAASASAARWLATSAAYVMRRRLRARDLALAYYRYQRALVTGKTIALPGAENPPYTSLPELKRQFEAQINPQAPAAPAPEADVEADIEVETIEGLDDELKALEKEIEPQVRQNLQVLGPQNQDAKIRQGTPRVADDLKGLQGNIDRSRSEAHAQAGRRQAAAAERNVLNGGRAPLHLVAQRDKRALGYVRYSKTGTPCAFCAMLISRGVVYKSEQSANDVDLWHDNCHCIAIPVWSVRQFQSDKLFALNREYKALWDDHIKGKYSGSADGKYRGNAALQAWRKLLNTQAKSQKSQEAAA